MFENRDCVSISPTGYGKNPTQLGDRRLYVPTFGGKGRDDAIGCWSWLHLFNMKRSLICKCNYCLLSFLSEFQSIKDPPGSKLVRMSPQHPLACRKRRVNDSPDDTGKTRDPACHSRCDTIKTSSPAQRSWALSIGLKFATLHWQWWRLHRAVSISYERTYQSDSKFKGRLLSSHCFCVIAISIDNTPKNFLTVNSFCLVTMQRMEIKEVLYTKEI
jgi:hypothetical protein